MSYTYTKRDFRQSCGKVVKEGTPVGVHFSQIYVYVESNIHSAKKLI